MTRRNGRRPDPAARDLRGPVLRTLLLLTALLLGALPPPTGERAALPPLPATSTVRPADAGYAPGAVPAGAASRPGAASGSRATSGPGVASGPRAASGPDAASGPRATSATEATTEPHAPAAPSVPAAQPAPPHPEAPHAARFTGGLRAAPHVRCPAPVLRAGPGAGPEQTYHPLSGTPPAAVLPVPPYTGPRPPRIRAAFAGAPGFAALPPARAPPSSGS
ncbi:MULTISPECIES: hypothetical protein [Streptomyces]|uniref:Uncharacterized protein n=1 Tax=Streptomyces ramulosus TaxID=47762 RepID=A0ABW1FKH6_9ACTN